MKKFTLIALMGFLFGAAGCNTIQGAGEDVEAAGETVAETAQDAKENLKD